MRKNGKAQKTEAPTGARPELDWINFSGRFLSAFICVHLRLKCLVPTQRCGRMDFYVSPGKILHSFGQTPKNLLRSIPAPLVSVFRRRIVKRRKSRGAVRIGQGAGQGNRRQQQRRQDGDDGNDHEPFRQGEGATGLAVCRPEAIGECGDTSPLSDETTCRRVQRHLTGRLDQPHGDARLERAPIHDLPSGVRWPGRRRDRPGACSPPV